MKSSLNKLIPTWSLAVLFAVVVQAPSQVYGQIFNPEYADIVAKCSYDSLLNDLKYFDSLGVKEMETEAVAETMHWIQKRYTRLGYTDIVIDPFERQGIKGENIIITKQGIKYPDQYLVVDAHYDTKRGPGANDNGSGTVILLELARLLKDVETNYSIKFIHFSGEEDGLWGSQHYVRSVAVPDSLDLTLILNIDQVGGVAGDLNNTIVCERDEGNLVPFNDSPSADATDYLAKCVGLYSDLNTTISYAYGSDYMPFEAEGYVITGFYEDNVSPFGHTPSDTWENTDPEFLHQMGRASLGAVLHFAEIGKNYVGGITYLEHDFQVYPNPFNNQFRVGLGKEKFSGFVRVYNTQGKLVYETSVKNQNQVDVSMDAQPAGAYFLRLETSKVTSKGLLILKE